MAGMEIGGGGGGYIRTEYCVIPSSLESPPCLYTQLMCWRKWREHSSAAMSLRREIQSLAGDP